MFLIAIVTICPLAVARCSEEPAVGEPTPQEVIFSQTAESGLLFLNGKHLDAPYHIEATAESISVNGTPCKIQSQSLFRRGGPFEGQEFHEGGMGMRGGFGNRRHFGERGPNRVGELNESADSQDAPVERRRPEFRPRAGFWNRSAARRITDALDEDQVVLLFEQTGELIVVPDSLEFDLCDALLNKTPATELLQNLAESGPTSRETMYFWRDWLQSYSPPAEVVALLTKRYDKWQQVADKNNREVAAMRRLDSFSYPLTLLGMLVGVVSLGHLLRWPRKNDLPEAGSETVRAVEIALWLMLGMALIDLIWTILASQAGVMKEVNPLAEKLIHSPLQLAVLKTFATGVGLAIFFLWRRRKQIQVATWWMCLVCVLVTFRWIIFDSAMSP